MARASFRYVFVYGTLRKGEARDINRLLPAPRWVGRACVPGVLYDLGAYPALLLDVAGSVHGEVYKISPELESLLDQIEEVWPQQGAEYCKRERAVQLKETAESVVCLVYEMALDRISGLSVIACGDWVQHRLSSDFSR